MSSPQTSACVSEIQRICLPAGETDPGLVWCLALSCVVLRAFRPWLGDGSGSLGSGWHYGEALGGWIGKDAPARGAEDLGHWHQQAKHACSLSPSIARAPLPPAENPECSSCLTKPFAVRHVFTSSSLSPASRPLIRMSSPSHSRPLPWLFPLRGTPFPRYLQGSLSLHSGLCPRFFPKQPLPVYPLSLSIPWMYTWHEGGSLGMGSRGEWG